MKEPIYIPEEHLLEFSKLLRKAIKKFRITKELKLGLTTWCSEVEQYLSDDAGCGDELLKSLQGRSGRGTLRE